IYQQLLAYTHQLTSKINGDKFLYYSDEVEQNDIWSNERFIKKVQQGGDLGERMGNAFTELFKAGYHKLIIIGSDCIELDEALIGQAFKLLADHKVVIGPSLDGGYYLLGLSEYIPALFTNKQWGTSSVLEDTLHDLQTANINLAQLTALNDIDEETDLPASLKERFDGANWLQ
ncbi:MAG: TIGR04282 family arsenosugar biosynthesis glycosyltransferase, partial [Aquabacterium sp.]|nr:TIGR04282 family arsenosugar biosynthesis glycosyltransferase [Ferruginibacter sp.]